MRIQFDCSDQSCCSWMWLIVLFRVAPCVLVRVQFVHQHVKECENTAGDAKHAYMRLSSSKNQIDERIRELEGQEAVKNDAIAGLEKKIGKAKKLMNCEGSDESWNDIVAHREETLKQAEL